MCEVCRLVGIDGLCSRAKLLESNSVPEGNVFIVNMNTADRLRRELSLGINNVNRFDLKPDEESDYTIRENKILREQVFTHRGIKPYRFHVYSKIKSIPHIIYIAMTRGWRKGELLIEWRYCYNITFKNSNDMQNAFNIGNVMA